MKITPVHKLLFVFSLFVLLATFSLQFTYVGTASATVASPTPPTATPLPCTDSRLNCTYGDEYALIHNGTDAAGDSALKITCMDAAGKGTFGGSFSAADVAGFPAKPASNTLVKTITCGSVPVKLFILTTGQYQINIGPNAKGNIIVMIFTGFPPTGISFFRLDADR
jgi:hypothetical protein